MSLKSMLTKLAIAFVAAKGVQAFQQGGGMEGVKRKLAQQKQSGQGLGGLMGAGQSGGLGGVLGQLGLNTGTGGSGGLGGLLGGGAAAGGIGSLLGGLAGASQGGNSDRMRGLLDTTEPKPVGEEAEAGLAIRAMVMAAKADGEIDETERRTLWEVLGDSDEAERAFVDAALAAPVDVEALARDVPKGMELEIYAASLMAITPDNRAEAQYLDALARRLGLEQSVVNEVHRAQGKTPLYTL